MPLSDIAQRDPASVRRLYRCHQSIEALERTSRIVDRLLPVKPTPHGFFEPLAFMADNNMAARNRLSRAILPHIRAKIEARDTDKSTLEIAAIMERTKK